MPLTGLFWFSHDLRLHDNPALALAARAVERLVCVYCIDEADTAPNRYGLTSLGPHRARFLRESLAALDARLEGFGQHLLVRHGRSDKVIGELIERFGVDVVFRSEPIGVYEQQRWDWLQRAFPGVRFAVRNGHTLYARNQLPFSLDELPGSFTPFRERVEALDVPVPRPAPRRLPRPPLMPAEWISRPRTSSSDAQLTRFRGGTDSGRARLLAYFSGSFPRRYKEVRNALEGWENSSKWSPWLANGSLSVREVVHALRAYERRSGGNASTYWLFFELLWREYFQWYAMAHGRRLFAFAGTRRRRPLTSFYPGRFARWSAGSTPYPLVNACMNQLNATGYLSNRGRQIAASCLVNELGLDWRYGAAYFEQQLVDYDVAINWGNWQYLAGVGADPRGQRHFDLERQAAQFDPDGAYVARWAGNSALEPLDSVDAADWPIGGAMLPA